MGQSDEGDDKTEREYDELCLELNMDLIAKEVAWNSYDRIRTNYTLEGDSLHWLACALYVACRGTVVETVGKGMTEGNFVSLTRLLRSSKLRNSYSLLQFFSKMKKWLDMANLSPIFREKIDHLERNFAVSTVIFKKYDPIYRAIFKNPTDDPPKQPKNRKQRRLPCSSSEMFNFCWTMFVQVKGTFPAISDDLVNSYHLLLCCIDFFYANVLLANRKDLLNPDFAGLPENWNSKEYSNRSEAPCILELLCDQHKGLVVEAKVIKEHWWRPYIKKLFDKKILKGRPEQFIGVVDSAFFESNVKAIGNCYEEYVLSVGDFDERIFLGDEANSDIGTPVKATSLTEETLSEKMLEKKNLRQHVDQTTSLAPSTPLTGRRYLKDQDHGTPISTATQGVSRLQSLLSGRKTGPGEKLLEIFQSCATDTKDTIVERVHEMAQVFCRNYAQPTEDHPGSQMDFAKKRLQLGESLYYKTLESILTCEKARLSSKNVDLSHLLEQETFHQSLFACCLEIVIYSYNSQRIFPWVVDIFQLSPYNMYKVIEVVIRNEPGLSRDVVKHLNRIEEIILEELAWKSTSPLWDALSADTKNGPPCSDVALPSQLEGAQSGQPHSFTSPMMHPVVRRLAGEGKSSTIAQSKDLNQSPIGTSLSDRFLSPSAGNAKRQLFKMTQTIDDSSKVTGVGRSVVQLHMAQTEDGRQVLIPIKVIPPNITSAARPVSASTDKSDGTTTAGTVAVAVAVAVASPPKPENKPKKSGSMALFFRKVYHLASVRLRDLCDRLCVGEDVRRKMWTCFEYSLVNHAEIMMDRHIDQLLMCAVYVIAKVTESNLQFQDIMKEYRLQPQANSSVYRSVLLQSRHRRVSGDSNSSGSGSASNSPVNVEEKDKEKDTKRSQRLSSMRSSSTLPVPQPNSQPPTPTKIAGTSSVFEFEDRGDLINFYNQIYVKKIKMFALKFSVQKDKESYPPLSPLPISRPHPTSPRRVSNNHSVYISPHKSSGPPMTPKSRMLYCFNRSPAKDLRAINKMLQIGERTKLAGKRLLQGDDQDEVPAKKLCATESNFGRRLKEVQSERDRESSDL